MGRRSDPPEPLLLPQALFFREVTPPHRFCLPGHDNTEAYCHVSMTDLAGYAGNGFGHRFVLMLEGLRLPDLFQALAFANWLARFVEDEGPIGTSFSPDMPDQPARIYFVRQGQLRYGRAEGLEQPVFSPTEAQR